MDVLGGETDMTRLKFVLNYVWLISAMLGRQRLNRMVLLWSAELADLAPVADSGRCATHGFDLQ